MVKFNMPSCPTLPLPPSKKGHFMMHCTPSWETDLSILRQYKENLVGVLQMRWHHFLFCIFRMKSWKNFINTSLIIPKLCPFSWAFFLKLPFSFYQLNSALPHPPQRSLWSLHLFAWKGHHRVFLGWVGIGQLATHCWKGSLGTGVWRGILGLWKQERL